MKKRKAVLKKNHKKKWLFLIILSLITLSAFSQNKPRLFFFEQNYGAKALGMSNSFTAQADDLSAVWLNPSGLAFLKSPSFFMSYKLYNQSYSYENQELNDNFYDYESKVNLKKIDFFSLSGPVILWDNHFTFAVSYYNYYPYKIVGSSQGQETELEEITQSTNLKIEGSNGIDVLAFSASFMINDYFSVGVTYQTFFNSGQQIYNYTFLEEANDYSETETMKITGNNFIFGAIFRPDTSFSLAFSCETRIKGEYQYSYNKKLGIDKIDNTENEKLSTGNILIPYRLNLGLAVKLLPFLQVSYDHKRVYWSKSTVSDFLENITDIAFPILDDFTMVQQDLICNRFGVETSLEYERIKVFLRTGFFFDKQLYIDSTDSKVKIKGFSLGLGFYLLNQLKLDIGYLHKSGKWTENGYFDTTSSVNTILKDNVVSLSLQYNFFISKN